MTVLRKKEDTVPVYARVPYFDIRVDQFMLGGRLPTAGRYSAHSRGLVLTISATVGTLLYFALDSWVLVTLLDMILMLILFRILGMRVPAAYAFLHCFLLSSLMKL